METNTEHPAPLLALLADPTAWHLVVRLARSDDHQRGLAAALHQPTETIAEHLAVLRHLGLLHERQSDVHADDTFYRLDLDATHAAFQAAAQAIHPVVAGISETEAEPAARPRVLFLCTGNSALSQMAEGLMRQLSKGRVEVFSAGSQPSQINPLAMETMTQAGIDISQQRSKHMDEFAGQQFDYVITVCDQQQETCPVFPGTPQRLHWSFADPVRVEPEEARRYAFKSTANQLRNLIRHFLILIERNGTIQ